MSCHIRPRPVALILVFFVSAVYGPLAFAANVTVTPGSGATPNRA